MQLIRGVAGRISENGLRPGYSPELQTSISLSNWVAIGYILMTFPFIVLYSDSPLAVLACLLPIFVYGSTLWLIGREYHLTARLLIANFCPLAIYIVSCLVFIDEANSALSAKVLLLGSIVVPLVIFRFREYRYIVFSVGFMCALLLTIDYTNAHFPVKIMQRNVNTPALQILCFAEAIVFLVVFFSYYKYTNHKATARISQLLHDVTVQNQRMIQAHAELMESEHMLKELNESKNKLFSIIAHDLRAPLNSFKGFSGLLSSNIHALSKEEIEVLVKGMHKSFHNVNTLLDNLLNWSRSQMNMFNFRADTFEVDVLVTENISLLEKAAQDKDITLLKSTPADTYAVMDLNAFNVVLRNLATNAIKFTPRGGRVEIRTIKQGNFIRMEVQDNGVGLSEEAARKLFRFDTATTTLGTANERGTGLGLILCKEFVEKSGGAIGVESTPGKGSTFFFTVPAYQGVLFHLQTA
jgi:signal transduction histidine kinase